MATRNELLQFCWLQCSESSNVQSEHCPQHAHLWSSCSVLNGTKGLGEARDLLLAWISFEQLLIQLNTTDFWWQPTLTELQNNRTETVADVFKCSHKFCLNTFTNPSLLFSIKLRATAYWFKHLMPTLCSCAGDSEPVSWLPEEVCSLSSLRMLLVPFLPVISKTGPWLKSAYVCFVDTFCWIMLWQSDKNMTFPVSVSQ